MSFPTDLTKKQKHLIESILDGKLPKLRKYRFFPVLNAIFYVMKTGVQWSLLPKSFPHWRSVYHHFRSWTDRGWFHTLLQSVTGLKRKDVGRNPAPTVTVIDSQSVRSALPHSCKGIDGHKRIKGIKRHLAVDSHGFPLAVYTTTANIHDSRGASPLITKLLTNYRSLETVKADKGYTPLERVLGTVTDVRLECVKSNFGTSDFIPMHGRWVVERTFSWLENYRRLTRNYEVHLKVAEHVMTTTCLMFMLRYFR